MRISASIKNNNQHNDISVATENAEKKISIPVKAGGRGSSVNGGELLFLSLATCFCNDVYREAAKRNMQVDTVEVTVSGEFGKEGEPGSNIVYNVKVVAPEHTEKEIEELVQYVDKVAEVHNTLRQGVSVRLENLQHRAH